MKKVKDEDLDKLFKSGLEGPGHEPVYREADWEAMEQVLDKGKKRPAIILWLPWLSAAAVVILVLLGWLLFRPQTESGNSNKDQQQMSAVKGIKEKPGTSGGAIRPNAADSSSKQKILTPANYATNPVHHGEAKNTNRSYPYLPVASAAKLPGKGTSEGRKEVGQADATQSQNNTNVLAATQSSTNANRKDVGQADANANNGTTNPANTNTLAANSPDKKEVGQGDAKPNTDASNPVSANTLAANSPDKKEVGQGDAKTNNDTNSPANGNNIAANAPKVKARVKGLNPNNRTIYAISAIGSSDMNGVNGMQGSRVGGNIGGMFSVTSGKWTLSTGAMYSIKPYAESYEQYHTGYVFSTPPSSIGVNCKMIDIPLNVNYQVYKHQANRITLGTGLSSYIILREDYSFNYSNPYAYGPAGYSVINKNRNILSVVNLDATFDHQINSKFGITFEPYVKLPFSNVGASQAKLQSAGIAVSLNYNLNPFKKPN
jgi:hypothetical protein